MLFTQLNEYFLYLSKVKVKKKQSKLSMKITSYPCMGNLNGPINDYGYGTFVGRSTRWFLSELPSIRRRRKSGVYIDLD